MRSCLVVIFAVFAVVSVYAKNGYEDYWDALHFVDQCGTKPLTLCLKERALKLIEKLPDNLDIGEGIRIKQTEGERTSRNHVSVELPDEVSERENVIDDLIWDRLFDYLSTHKLEFKMPKMAIKGLERSMEEGRKKKNKGGGNMMMIMMAAMKLAILKALAIKTIGLIAFKALLVAKIALTISLVIALKKLTEQKHTSYEVVAHPHFDDHFDRSFSQDLAYRGYNQPRSL